MSETENLEATSNGKSDHKIVSFDMVSSIPVSLTVEIGKARLTIGELMSLKVNDIVALNKLENEPFEIKVNGQNIAEGEIVVSDNQFYMKITKVIDRVHYD